MNKTQPAAHDSMNPISPNCGKSLIDAIENSSFNVGSAIKNLCFAGENGPVLEDLENARWHLDREIQRLQVEEPPSQTDDGTRPEPPLTTTGGRPIRSAVEFAPSGQGLLVTCRWCEHEQTHDCIRCGHVL